MGILDDIADKLALETIAVAEKTGDDNLIAEVAKVIGASSTTTQEAFMTAIRVRLSEKRARKFLRDKLAKGPVNPGGPKKELGSGPILDQTDEPAGGGH